MNFFRPITFVALLLLSALCSAADRDSIRIALLTDPHFTEGNLKQTTPRMPLLAQDANHRIPDIDLVMGLGDEVHDHAAWIGVWKREPGNATTETPRCLLGRILSIVMEKQL